MSQDRLYFDCAATTPLDKQVASKMRRFLIEDGCFGNASSATHLYGAEASQAVEQARKQVAASLGCRPSELIWVSGATEANNLAILGTVEALLRRSGRRSKRVPVILTTATEHLSVLEPIRSLRNRGCKVTLLRVDSSGRLALEDFEKALRTFRPLFASVGWVNNETSVVQDIKNLSLLCKRYGVMMHTDAAQAFGKCPIDLKGIAVDFASFSAHKSGGPKGIGALFVRKTAPLLPLPLLLGGGQERGLRPGTVPVHQVVGMGEAFALTSRNTEKDTKRITKLSATVQSTIAALNGIIHGEGAVRVPHILNVYFRGVSASRLLALLSDVAISQGSACSSSETEPSHVLRAMHCSSEQAKNSVRLSFGRMTKPSMVSALIKCLERAVPSARI